MQFIFFLLRNPLFWFLVILFWGAVHYYNKLINAQLKTEEALANIERLLKQRMSMIPKLSNASININEQAHAALRQLKQYHEYAPEGSLGQSNIEQRAQDYYHISQQLNAYFHATPEPKAEEIKQFYTKSYDQFSQTESKLGEAISDYNKQAGDYNVMLESFPSGVLAAMLNMEKKGMFV